MTIQEDSWTVDSAPVIEAPTEVVIPEVIPEVVETQVVETALEEQSVVDEQVNKLSDSDIDDLLKAITDWIEKQEDVPTEPTLFQNKEEEIVEQPITNEEMEALDTLISDQETLISERDATIATLSSQIEAEIQKQNAIEEIWNKVVSNPTIWPFALQIANWENPNIPDIILNQLQREISSMPNIWDSKQISIKPEPVSNQSRIYWVKTLWE